jgi:Flp pilus assembly protein TadG
MSARGGKTRLFGLFRGPDSDSGVSAVEFAMIAPIFLAMVLGIIDLGRAGFAQAVMFKAAQETSRWVVVNPRNAGAGETEIQYQVRVQNVAASRLNVLTGTAPTVVAVATADAALESTSVDLTITYNFNWIMPFVVGGTTTFTSHSNGFLVEDL